MISMIKSESQYAETLSRLETLVRKDPLPSSPEGRELEVLGILIQDFERTAFPLAAPNPLVAIRLRMEQANLAPKDLVTYLGSRSKVSEVLAGKRPLSLAMIRALHSGLGIPLEALVADQPEPPDTAAIDWDRFPIKEMVRRGWLGNRRLVKGSPMTFSDTKALLEEFFSLSGRPALANVVLHKTDRMRTATKTDKYSLSAWASFVQKKAHRLELSREFQLSDWTEAGLRELRSLSRFDVGPRLAVQYLEERGIIVEILPHLPRTRLDGAAMLRDDGAPIIAMTIRHDRIDNFWFTLFHELMHILLHLKSVDGAVIPTEVFLDDLDIESDLSLVESQADDAAREALIPSLAWEASAARYAPVPVTIADLARDIGVADAVVAGRARHEQKNFKLLSMMIGSGKVRPLFPEVEW